MKKNEKAVFMSIPSPSTERMLLNPSRHFEWVPERICTFDICQNQAWYVVRSGGLLRFSCHDLSHQNGADLVWKIEDWFGEIYDEAVVKMLSGE